MVQFRNFFLIFTILSIPVFCEEGSLNQAIARINALFLIKDPALALEECTSNLQKFPESLDLQKLHIKALAENGFELDAIKEWKAIESHILDEKERESLFETIAWGVLLDGKNSSQLMMNNFSLLGAFLTQDARAVAMIRSAMQSSNSMQRALAVRLASQYGDSDLKEQMIQLLKHEKISFVRFEVIKAIGALQLKQASEYLKDIIYDQRSLAEEKVYAIQSLATLYDHIQQHEIIELLNHKRGGFRILAAEVISRLHLYEHLPLLVARLDDPITDVRMHFLNAIGILNPNILAREKELLTKLCRDPHHNVAITAAWIALQAKIEIGSLVLREKIESEDPALRRFTAAVIALSGKKGMPIAMRVLEKTKDPFVQANLYFGLLRIREREVSVCNQLFNFLQSSDSALINWEEQPNPLFTAIAPSKAQFTSEISNFPALADGMTRLSIINALAMIDPDKAIICAKNFLANSHWGLIIPTAELLIEEGEMYSLEIIKQLLDEKEEKVRLQAAFVLAFIGSDDSAIKVLEESYYRVHREVKLQILEALGKIGSKKCLPFLLKILEEPFQGLRIAAASAIIQSLYH